IAEGLSGPNGGHPIATWGIGIVAALVMATYGLACVVAQEATFFGGRPIAIVTYTGTLAMCLGVAYVSLALFMHCHFTWSHSERYHGFAHIGQLISAATTAAATGYFAFYFFAYT
ncbi:MAG: hypothetical protein ACC645_17885, partial [Pirellulales bacterium]